MTTRATLTRFLNSLGLDDLERFHDLTITRFERDKHNRSKWLITINKENAWDYEVFSVFLRGLDHCSYPFEITFTYTYQPTPLDAISLFDPWYQTIYHSPSRQEINIVAGNILEFVFSTASEYEDNASMLKEFQSFLTFIKYEIPITSRVILKSNDEIDELNGEELTLGDEVPKFSDEDDFIGDEIYADIPLPDDAYVPYAFSKEEAEATRAAIQSARKKNLSKAEIESLQEARENLAKMEKDRAFSNRFKKGDYRPLTIAQMDTNSKNVDFDGVVFSKDSHTLRNGKQLFTFGVGQSNGQAIYVKAFEQKKNLSVEKLSKIRKKDYIRIRGNVALDDYSKELSVIAHYIDALPPKEKRDDLANKKRVELHLHTKMSVMDGVNDIDEYCELAAHMGHKAIAITDHGAVQAFPDAQRAAEKHGLKMIYGAEMYMIDTKLGFVMNPSPINLSQASYVIFDLETTGLSARYDRVIEFGAVKVVQGMVRERLNLLINPGPGAKMSEAAYEVSGISLAQLRRKPEMAEVMPQILDFIGDSILVTHNAEFDIAHLNNELHLLGLDKITNPVIDTLSLSRYLFPESKAHRLGSLANRFSVAYDTSKAHRAQYDAEVLYHIWAAMQVILHNEHGINTHEQLENLVLSKEIYDHLYPHHVVVLAINEQGLKDLFKLISLSNIEYIADVPKIPRHILSQYRDNLLVGSACFNGEVFEYAKNRSAEDLAAKVRFYDYIEIQPPANYSYLINMGDFSDEDELYRTLNDILTAAKEEGKLVVATGDVHYLNPEDKIYRDVYIMAKAVGGINHPLAPYSRDRKAPFENPDQHFRSTIEMIEAFTANDFLTLEEAEEIVVENSNAIADAIKPLKPIKTGLFAPHIENVDKLLTDLVYENARKLYGSPLPEPVSNRIRAELKGIINNEFAVIYYIAYKLVKQANDEGHLVGSRGSVGSSFVARLSQITEVNPLTPHYRCPNCQYSDFEPEEVNKYDIRSGFDLPKKNCPRCDHLLVGDGHNIPFETFLGFDANKIPDIDLNFPGEYQAIAHENTKALLGEQNVFRAGTIETVAERTSFGYVRGYFERIGRDLADIPRASIEYIASGCTGVKRTTGQHPGGIVVIPEPYDVYDFTPIQYPAEDTQSTWKTTHFDFNALQDNLLKLDLLGHVDPSAIKMMSEMTGVNIEDIDIVDGQVMSLFSSAKALKLRSNTMGLKNGALAIPEFGTNYVRSMLDDTKPKTFADLLIISGLSHGTGVWSGNAQELVKKQKFSLVDVIGCRDDIMIYLIEKGLEPKDAFRIMEDVRRSSKTVSKKDEELMRKHNVPEYYIDSCRKISYMFPKSHAAAYVMMALRVAWFKVYKPLAFYAVYFSIRTSHYDIATMIKGKEALIAKLREFSDRKRSRDNPLQRTEEEVEKTLTIALEMVERGYSFANLDIYRSEATRFVCDHENKAIIPPFTTIPGLGESAAQSVIEARKDGEFLSVQDLVERTRLNSSSIEYLRNLGILESLPETNQISLFDFF